MELPRERHRRIRLRGRGRARRAQGLGQPRPRPRGQPRPAEHAAAVFTSNRAQANPIIWSKQVIADGQVSAIVLNSGGANCFTGAQGFQTTHATAEAVAAALDLSAGDVLVCSTGLIGEQLPVDKLTAGVATRGRGAEPRRRDGCRDRHHHDRHPREDRRGVRAGWSIGGMAKGAGMLAPGLATMLVVITTDAVLDSPRSTPPCAPRPASASTGSTRTAACRPTTR